jgi:hypothetical protein
MTQMYLTRQDVENYGTDLVDFAQRAAIQATAPHLNALQQQNQALNQQLAIEQRHRLDQQVAEAVPNLEEVDNDPRWHQWLRGMDPLNARIRQELLNNAIAAADAGRVKAFFDSFEREAQGASHGADRGPARRGGRAPSHGTRTWTRASIDEFYRARQKGAYKGREAEADAIEADLFAAQHEGRVEMYPYISK